MKQTDLILRDLALLVAIATIPVEAQSALDSAQSGTAAAAPARRSHQRENAAITTRSSQAQATYTNPVWDHDFPDPFVLFWDGRYYAYATESRITGFQVMESTDLIHWTHRGVALEVPWSRRHYWAPEVVYYRGKFYMTYSAENPANRKHDIGIAVSDRPLGPFRHAAKLVEAGPGQRGVIDATIFFDRDGRPYLIYSEEDPRSIVIRPMRDDLLAVEQEREVLIRPDRAWEHGVTEAPTMIYRDGHYHLFYSAGYYQGDKANCRYCVAHAVAKDLRGPYVKSESQLLQTVVGQVYGPGHQCIIVAPDGHMWMFYHGWSAENEPHYGSNRSGRTLRLDRVFWHGDEPSVEGPTLSAQPAPVLKKQSAVGSRR